MFLLVPWGCKEVKSPLTPAIDQPPGQVLVGVKGYTFKISIDFTGVPFSFPPPDYLYYEGYVFITVDKWPLNTAETSYRGGGIFEKELSWFAPGGGEWQMEANKTHSIDARYSNIELTPELQRGIRWRFQVIEIKLNDSQYPGFKVKTYYDGKEGTDTGWFSRWEADYSFKTLFTFLIYK